MCTLISTVHKYQRFSVDPAAAVGSLVVSVGLLLIMGSRVRIRLVHFHVLHFVSDIYFLVSKILSSMWNLEIGDVKDPTPKLNGKQNSKPQQCF